MPTDRRRAASHIIEFFSKDLHGRDAGELILEDQHSRFFTYTPQLAPPNPASEPVELLEKKD